MNWLPQDEAAFNAIQRELDPSGSGNIPGPIVAAKLKTTGVPTEILGQIWSMADSMKTGSFNKQSLFVALKLIALAQNGKPVAMNSLNIPTPPPNFGGSGANMPAAGSPQTAPASSSIITTAAKHQSDAIFNTLNLTNGKVSGQHVMGKFMESGLPKPTLGQIWALSDCDKDGFLTSDEFGIAWYLIGYVKSGNSLPSSLPPNLLPTTSSWVVTDQAKQEFDAYFAQADTSGSGIVTGQQVMGIFQKSGLSQDVLFQVWKLVDMETTGKLDKEQFALAMYLIKLKKQGGVIPTTLPESHIPPSWRGKTGTSGGDPPGVPAASSPGPQLPAHPIHDAGDPLENIRDEIESLKQKKEDAETERIEKEMKVSEYSSEVFELEKEVREAQNHWSKVTQSHQQSLAKISELERQKAEYERLITDVQSKFTSETSAVNELKASLETYNSSQQQQEDDMKRAHDQINTLKTQQQQMAQQVELNYKELDTTTKRMETIKVDIEHVKKQIQREELLNKEAANQLQKERDLLAQMTNKSLAGPEDPFNTSGQNQNAGAAAWGTSDPFSTGFDSDPFAANSSTPNHEYRDPFAASKLSEAEQLKYAMEISKKDLTYEQKEELDMKAAMEASMRQK